MKKYTYGIVALMFSLVLLAGCATGTNGNPTELTGTWTGKTVNDQTTLLTTDVTTRDYTVVVTDDGSYTLTQVTTEKVGTTTTTTTYIENGYIYGSVTADRKYVTLEKISSKTTVSGSTVTTTDTDSSSITSEYYLTGSKLVIIDWNVTLTKS